jgi:hypothetical protein
VDVGGEVTTTVGDAEPFADPVPVKYHAVDTSKLTTDDAIKGTNQAGGRASVKITISGEVTLTDGSGMPTGSMKDFAGHFTFKTGIGQVIDPAKVDEKIVEYLEGVGISATDTAGAGFKVNGSYSGGGVVTKLQVGIAWAKDPHGAFIPNNGRFIPTVTKEP